MDQLKSPNRIWKSPHLRICTLKPVFLTYMHHWYQWCILISMWNALLYKCSARNPCYRGSEESTTCLLFSLKISPRKRKGLYIKILSEIVGVHLYPLQLSARLCVNYHVPTCFKNVLYYWYKVLLTYHIYIKIFKSELNI